MKRLFIALIAIACIFTTISCGGGSDSSEALESVTIKGSDIVSSTEWFPIDKNTQIELSEIGDSDVFVVLKKSASNARGSIKGLEKGNNNKGGLIASETGNTIIRQDEDGNAKFAGSGVGAKNGVYYAKVEKLPSQSIEAMGEIGLEVYDWENEEEGTVFIENSKCDYYYVSEKALHINLNKIRQNTPDALKQCVIIREKQNKDSSKAKDPDFKGLHNTLTTYGFLLKDGNEYIIKNAGVCDLSQENFVNVYAGYASNVIMGSGYQLSIVPITVMNLNTPIDIVDPDVALAVETGLNKGEEKDYVLKFTEIEDNDLTSFSIYKNNTEIRDYSGNQLPQGMIYSFDEGADTTFYYYLGKLSGSFYVDNHAYDKSKPQYKVELIEAGNEELNGKVLKQEKVNKIIFEVGTDGTEGISTETDGSITYKKVYSEIDDTSKKNGHLSVMFTDVPAGTHNFLVKFEKWNGSEWVDREYNNSSLQCSIGHISTGNELLNSTFKVSSNDNTCPIQMEYHNISEPVRAIITFEYQAK